ncbi:MAG: hypothetical protein M3Q39_11240 [Actinomycetota bacterium]|nr:hypothetical protein [Actinomycetota bacterium]
MGAAQGASGTCIHFRVLQGRCAAGVAVEALRDPELRLPCVAPGGCRGSVACDEMQLPAPPARSLASSVAGEMTQALELLLEGRCPTCAELTTGEIESGGNVFAVPCHHQLAGRRRRSA